jgi:hypothetical protein
MRFDGKLYCCTHHKALTKPAGEAVVEAEIDCPHAIRKKNGTYECFWPHCTKYGPMRHDERYYCKNHYNVLTTPEIRCPPVVDKYAPVSVNPEEGVQISPSFSYNKAHGQFYANSKPQVLRSQNLDPVETRGPPIQKYDGYEGNTSFHIEYVAKVFVGPSNN